MHFESSKNWYSSRSLATLYQTLLRSRCSAEHCHPDEGRIGSDQRWRSLTHSIPAVPPVQAVQLRHQINFSLASFA